MPRFTDDFIEEVRSHNDIVDVIGQYVRLTKKGNRYWGLCPFHGEKTGSFSVKPDEQFFYCFGCHVGGNVFRFVEQMERTDFVGAVEKLAERAHLDIPEPEYSSGAHKGPSRREQREKLLEAGKLAARFYHEQLMGPGGREALDYLLRRGLDLRMIRRFGLGFAPEGWSHLKDALLRQGVSEETMVTAGLLQRKERRTYDAFRNRIDDIMGIT